MISIKPFDLRIAFNCVGLEKVSSRARVQLCLRVARWSHHRMLNFQITVKFRVSRPARVPQCTLNFNWHGRAESILQVHSCPRNSPQSVKARVARGARKIRNSIKFVVSVPATQTKHWWVQNLAWNSWSLRTFSDYVRYIVLSVVCLSVCL